MNLEKLEKFFENRPSFYLKQAKKAVFGNLIDDWLQATSLPLDLREKLNRECPLLIEAKFFISKDKDVIKSLIILKDGLKIESVLMRHKDGRNTVCVSSQIGCPLGCLFCATGAMGFKRNLDALEIVEQILFFARYLKKEITASPFVKGELSGISTDKSTPPLPESRRRQGYPSLLRSYGIAKYSFGGQASSGQALFQRREINKINNIVFMGMGEPFLNYDNVLGSIKVLNDKDTLNIGARHISISTIGLTEGIKKLTKERLQVNLAISLHAPNNILRSKIIPANKNYPIEKIFEAVDQYVAKSRRKVMFEYIMIKDFNDSPAYAKELASLLKKLKTRLWFVNLILYNPTGIFKPSSAEQIKKFKQILEKENITVTERHRFGRQIKGACGQLAGN